MTVRPANLQADAGVRSDATAVGAVRCAAPAAGAPSRLHSAALFDGRREVVIVHNGEEYRLRLTRQEKLILTK